MKKWWKKENEGKFLFPISVIQSIHFFFRSFSSLSSTLPVFATLLTNMPSFILLATSILSITGSYFHHSSNILTSNIIPFRVPCFLPWELHCCMYSAFMLPLWFLDSVLLCPTFLPYFSFPLFCPLISWVPPSLHPVCACLHQSLNQSILFHPCNMFKEFDLLMFYILPHHSSISSLLICVHT